jgi:hypothetical protein
VNSSEAPDVQGAVSFACQTGLAALAVSFLISPVARAQDKPRPRVVSSVDQVRLLCTGGVYRGTEMVGVGSREPYLGGLLQGEVLLTTMFTRRLGLDLGVIFGDANPWERSDHFYGRADAAAVTPLVQRDGPRGYSVLVGAGAGFTAGERWWWADARVYPYLLVRFTYLFTREISTFAQATIAPLDTTLVASDWATESRFEAGVGVGLFSAGTRVALASIQGGDPQRTYGDLEVTFYLGIGARFEPRGGKR